MRDMNQLKQSLLNVTWTENGALTKRSTLSAVLDFFYHAPAKRGQVAEVTSLFSEAYAEDPKLAILALFNLRDVRGGKGERDSFRACLRWLAACRPDAFARIAPLVPEYGRWDDLVIMYDQPVVRDIVAGQLAKDMESERPSLLAKWMPSLQTSSRRTRALAHEWRKALGMTEREYRRALSALRARIHVVERDMSAGRWSEINYPAVPARAALIYRRAFARHDGERYRNFITAVQSGEARINAGTLYPYELVHITRDGGYDDSIQNLWNALPDYTEGKVGLVVADVSGSMTSVTLPRSKAEPLDVSIALAIYYAQRNNGPWAGMAITFSQRPSVIDVPGGLPLDKAVARMTENIGYNTDFQAVFELILGIAQSKRIPQSEMPAAIWVVSDMEFDAAGPGTTNLDAVRAKYAAAGYKMPALVFWNVASRGMQTPAAMNEQGVALVSGFSPSTFQAALENRTATPYEAMMSVLLSDRYSRLTEALALLDE